MELLSLAHLDARRELTSLIRIFILILKAILFLPLPLPYKNRDRILGHQFDKRLESFAPSYSQSFFSTGGLLKKTRLYPGFKNTYKKSAEQENARLFINRIL
jgi:hypothetical protein